ncbi:DNA-binding protein [Bosea sp. Root381]|uniref:Zn-ribbon domain-containing OB-fold protein n=1 Tax=Bosea sp. Root381 TaxID=1736524 RepID=UPI0006F9035D|nr:OB-fold domain-containing protein [Bosea sp. Root381]KRE04385.1 DNA-binding protein [Bosea sp. Root381]
MSTDARFDGPGPDDVFAVALAEGRILLQHCRACGATRHPPALVCVACGSADLGWIEPSGRGTVYSTTTVRERDGAYNVAIIELAEGARLMSRVDGIAPEAVAIGLPVTARIVVEPQPHLVFQPVGEWS